MVVQSLLTSSSTLLFPPRKGNLPGSHRRLEAESGWLTLSGPVSFGLPHCSILSSLPWICLCFLIFLTSLAVADRWEHTALRGKETRKCPKREKSWRLATPTAQTVMRHASVLGKGPQYRSSRKGTVRKTDGGGWREVHRSRRKDKDGSVSWRPGFLIKGALRMWNIYSTSS